MARYKRKPLCLLEIFRQETDEAHRLTAPQLVRELAARGVPAERKGVYRDIRALVECGVDIRKSPTGYYLASRAFTPGEARLLVQALRGAPFLTPARAARLISRLSALLSRHQAAGVLSGGLYAPQCADDGLLHLLETVDGAIAARSQLSFACANAPEGAVSSAGRLRASPYAVLLFGGRCYMACNLEGRDDVSILPLSALSALRLDGTPWRHFSEVSPYTAAFNGMDYLS